MQISEIIAGNKGKLTIRTDGGLSFPLYQKEAKQYELCEGAELSIEKWEQIRREVLDCRAKRRALYLLERMERTECQLRRKLEQDGYPGEVTDCALEYVKSYHYVDDFRYACTYIRLHQTQKSRLQLKAGLRQRGVLPEVVEQAMEEAYEESEEELILRLLKKRQYDVLTAEEKEKQRTYQYLMRRGFSGESVRRLMHL